MKPLAKYIGAALVGALALLATPNAQAQVGVNINIGTPAWGPQVPYGTQYYYIPEIDGYYDLYAQQYIVFQDGYWVPLPQLYGYDPYQFHPVVIAYRGREPWLQSSYYHQRYAYQPYRPYGRGGYANGYYNNGYYSNGYGRGGYYGGGRGYSDRDRDRDGWGRNNGYGGGRDRDDDRNGRGYYGGGSYNGGPRGNQSQPGGYGNGPRRAQDVVVPPRGNQPQVLQPPQPGGNGGPAYGGPGGGRHGRD